MKQLVCTSYDRDFVSLALGSLLIVERLDLLTDSLRPQRTARNSASLSRLEPRLEIRFRVAVNFPDEKTPGSRPANAMSFLALSNLSISPTSDKIVAAILLPMPGIEHKSSNAAISSARASIELRGGIDALGTEEAIGQGFQGLQNELLIVASLNGFCSAAAISLSVRSSA